MAPTISPDRRSYRDSSPNTPLTPLSPSVLPQWLRHSRPRTAALTSGRLRLILIATVCIALGWMLTSSLGPSEQDLLDADEVYDTGSIGILDDPTGFGHESTKTKLQDGILGESEPPDATATDAATEDKELSVTGALADLHDAVKEKIQAWNPYASRPSRPARPHASANVTSPFGPQSTNSTSLALAGEDVKDGIGEEQRLGARVRIGKCTILFNGNSFWERAIRTHEQHDRHHGYRLHVLRQHLMDDVWSKPAYILSLLLRELAKPEDERLEWLLWFDADTIILNPYIPIDVFLPGSEFDDVHLLYSNDWNGLNNGVFPVRVNQWSAQLFSAITSFRHFRPDVDLLFRDQSAMDMLMQEPEFRTNIVQAPQRWFNAYQGEHNETLAPYQIRRGDFLVHFAGVANREERMGYWLDRAEQHLDDWEIPVKSTSYPQEVRDFWNEQRGVREQRKAGLAASRLKAKDVLAKVTRDLLDYGDRLGEDQRNTIQNLKEELGRLFESDGSASDSASARMDVLIEKLIEAAQPLSMILDGAQKLLLNSAHEAIFAAEKDLLENGFGKGISDTELDTLFESVEKLKQLVMMPQALWNRHDITEATNAVTEARTRLHGSLRALAGLLNVETVIHPVAVETATGAHVIVTGDPVVVMAAEVTADSQSEPLSTPAGEESDDHGEVIQN